MLRENRAVQLQQLEGNPQHQYQLMQTVSGKDRHGARQNKSKEASRQYSLFNTMAFSTPHCYCYIMKLSIMHVVKA